MRFLIHRRARRRPGPVTVFTMSVRVAVAVALGLVLPACGGFFPGPGGSGDAGETSEGGGESTDAPVPDLPAPGPEDMVVATFNVHLFFDTVCDSGSCGGNSFESAPTASAFAQRADQIAEAIAALDADVVLLQEVENQDCLRALSDRLPDYPTAYLGETGFPASVDTALLSRFPLVEIRSHGEAPIPLPDGGETYFAREFLEAHFERDGRRVIAFVAHFKSKNDDDPARRLAEASEARRIVDAAADANPDALVIMGGDLNDVPGSPPLNAIEDTGGMTRVAAELGEDDWTYVFDSELRALDHLYLSNRSSGGSFVTGTARVFRGPDGSGWGGSDHASLRATFRVGQ